jgi:hypothetical protein
MTVPGDWGRALGGDFRGRVRLRRGFHRPTGIEPHERAWLVVGGLDPGGAVAVNGERLCDQDQSGIHGYAVRRAFRLSELGDNNELVIVIDLPRVEPGGAGPLRPDREEMPGGIVDEIALELRATAFLDDLALWVAQHAPRDPTLELAGRVVAEQSGRLAVVAHVAGREVLYQESDVEPGDNPFALCGDAHGLPVWTPGRPCALAPVVVRLLDGGTCLWEQTCHMARRTIDWDEAAGRLAVAGMPLLPEGALAMPTGPLWQADIRSAGRGLGRPRDLPSGDALWLCDAILPDEAYDRLDAAGVCLAQAVPGAWARHVGPRLAHHPSIVAWSGTDLGLGRPCLTRAGRAAPARS